MSSHPVQSSAVESRYVAPTTTTERLLAEVLGEIVKTERVSIDSHFFRDLGADSMLMARFCARVRKRPDLPSVSMKDIYGHPTIRGLARLAEEAVTEIPASAPASVPAPTERVTPARTAEFLLCGALQLLFLCGYAFLGGLILAGGYDWIGAASSVPETYLRSVQAGGAAFLGLCVLPILAKWLLIGRWKRQQIRIWSLAYVRFWVVKTLIRTTPLVLFAGSPLYVLYLRALGARIGRGAVILSKHVPVCTDLLTIGDDAVVRKDSFFNGYRAEAGMIQTGSVHIGSGALVGEYTVLDIDTSLGDGAQLGHSSSLHPGQSIPDGEHRYGSPAVQRTGFDYRAVRPAKCGTLKRASFTLGQLLNLTFLGLPLGIGGLELLLRAFPELVRFESYGTPAFSSPMFYAEVAIGTFVFLIGSLLLPLVLAGTVPRVLNLFIEPGKVYPLYGFHYWAQRAITRLTNVLPLQILFGDSSYIVHYLRWLGYDLGRVLQTGSNFGTLFKHDNPYLVKVGRGTMIADLLSAINVDYSSTSFCVSPVTIGPNNYLGNQVVYPSQSRTGENCLLGTKVKVPVEGELREGIGLLGSPSFEIPRTIERDSRFDYMKSGDELRRRLAAKNRHNTVSIALLLLANWVALWVDTLFLWAMAHLYPTLGARALAAGLVGTTLFNVVYNAMVERASQKFRPLRPLYCSIYEPDMWSHERFWKLSRKPRIWTGTAFCGLIFRLLGVRIGKRFFDDGCTIIEKSLVTIGDDCTVNAGSTIQAHSQEDGTFKSDYVRIGAGCTLGVRAWVHYGVTMGDGAVLVADAFLMKGEEVPPHTRWGDNPARELRDASPAAPALQAGTTATPRFGLAARERVEALRRSTVR